MMFHGAICTAQGRREVTCCQDVEAQGAMRSCGAMLSNIKHIKLLGFGWETFSIDKFHHEIFPTETLEEGPADLMSFNAFFYFCTEFELFPKHALEFQELPKTSPDPNCKFGAL